MLFRPEQESDTPKQAGDDLGRLVLVPYDKADAIDLQNAAFIAGRSVSTMRNWCESFGVGRRIVGKWVVSYSALLMLLDGDHAALRAYHQGDRCSALVQTYLARAAAAATR